MLKGLLPSELRAENPGNKLARMRIEPVLRGKNPKILRHASTRDLADLVSGGPATVGALHSLGVHNVAQLACSKPQALYAKLCRLPRRREDPCCLDVFAAAIAQARDPRLLAEQCVWWYWSRQRKTKSEAR